MEVNPLVATLDIITMVLWGIIVIFTGFFLTILWVKEKEQPGKPMNGYRMLAIIAWCFASIFFIVMSDVAPQRGWGFLLAGLFYGTSLVTGFAIWINRQLRRQSDH